MRVISFFFVKLWNPFDKVEHIFFLNIDIELKWFLSTLFVL